MPAPLADCLDRLAGRLRTARHVLLCCDFDGTLVPICERPEQCRLDAAVGGSLAALAQNDRVTVAIVSGRALDDVRTRVGRPELVYAGNHGLEIVGPGLCFRPPGAERITAELQRLARQLRPVLDETAGAWLEAKGLSASVHYRQVDPAAVPQLLERVRQVVAPAVAAGEIVLRSGKMVLELRPAIDWHKGKAVAWLARQVAAPDQEPLVIYLGDDQTDEDAFTSLLGGFTVRVGEHADTAAQCFVRDTGAVHAFLAWLRDAVGC